MSDDDLKAALANIARVCSEGLKTLEDKVDHLTTQVEKVASVQDSVAVGLPVLARSVEIMDEKLERHLQTPHVRPVH